MDELLQYIVYFENVDSATAAAQEIEILDTLDTNLNWNSCAFSNLQIADTVLFISDSGQSYSNIISWNDTTEVQITGTFDHYTGIIRWYIRGTDTRTGDLADFLYSNQNPPEGEGWVSFNVNPKSNLATGDQIRNKAAIVFDVNPAVITNEVYNTIDAMAPVSQVETVNDSSKDALFEIAWSGMDDPNGSQIRNYSIYVSEDAGAYHPWLNQVSETMDIYPGEGNHTYWFYSIARDSVGNLESQPYQSDLSVWNAKYDFTNSGWYLAALSNTPANDSLKILFPNALESYHWNSATQNYTIANTLNTAKGYWLANSLTDTSYIAAEPLLEYSKHMQTCWHMIGGIAQPINFSNPMENPDSAIIATYGWNAETQSYFLTDTLLPNHGYWIAVVEECDLVISQTDTFTNIPVVQDLGVKIAAFYDNYGSMPPQPPPFPTSIEPVSQLPKSFNLYQNYPNPFNPITTIKYDLPAPGKTKLVIYNLLGQQVAMLVNKYQKAGSYQIKWDGTNNKGNKISSGIYFYVLISGNYQKAGKMIFLE